MTFEELSNMELLQLYKNCIMSSYKSEKDHEYILEIQEEIFSRMEVEGA